MLSWWHSEESACNAGDPGLIPGSGINLEKAMATHYNIYIYIFADIVKNTEIRPFWLYRWVLNLMRMGS